MQRQQSYHAPRRQEKKEREREKLIDGDSDSAAEKLRHKVVHLINAKSFAKVPLLLCTVPVAVPVAVPVTAAIAVPLAPGQLLKKVESRFAFG